MKRKIIDMGHDFRIDEISGYAEIDVHNSLFRNSKFCKIHYTAVDGLAYIRYQRHTYYF